jgi:hypothetical protein
MAPLKKPVLFVFAAFGSIAPSTAAFSQSAVACQSVVPAHRAKCVFSFKDFVSMRSQVQFGLYKYCDGMPPRADVTVELHGVATSQREARWRFCASPQVPGSPICRDDQTSPDTMGVDYRDLHPGSEVAISVMVSTKASRDGFAFAWIADMGCGTLSPGAACDVVLLPGATLTFSADSVQ